MVHSTICRPYRFVDVERLVSDFPDDIARARGGSV